MSGHHPRDGERRRGVVAAVIPGGLLRGAGRIQTTAGLAYFTAAEWRGAEPPRPGARVVFVHRGWNRATRVEPDVPVPEPDRGRGCNHGQPAEPAPGPGESAP